MRKGNVKVQEKSSAVGARSPAGNTEGNKSGKMKGKAEKRLRQGGFWEGNSRGPGGISEIRHKKKSFCVSETKKFEDKARRIGHSSGDYLDRGTG